MLTLVVVRPKCRNCGSKFVNRPKGLCWNCYYTPGVRERHESTSKYAFRGIGNGMKGGLKACEPTTVKPGPAKVAVMAARAEAGEALWHPLDAS
jgi:hypothetical protein